jgi:hypothetical protein
MADQLVGPFNEVLHIRRICVASIVLAPCQLSIEKSGVHGRHLSRSVIVFYAESFSADL